MRKDKFRHKGVLQVVVNRVKKSYGTDFQGIAVMLATAER